MDTLPKVRNTRVPSGIVCGEPVTPQIPPLPRSVSVNQESPHQETRRLRKPRRERKVACTACRQQKLKCDSHTNPANPCSRCSRLSISCFRSLEFQRVEVRKAQRRSTSVSNDKHFWNERRGCRENVGNSVTTGTGDELSSTCNNASIHANRTTSALPNTFVQGSQSSFTAQSDLAFPISTPTKARSLSDNRLNGKIIDECFHIFFNNHARYLPMFESWVAPDDCYQSSLTLFWAVVVVGSRSLTSDPTLLRSLAPEVLNIALTSFQSRRNLIDDIRGLLILCTWPCPSNSLLRDNTVALCGLLFSLSMQAGLHVPSSRFSRFTGPETETFSQQIELASLWAHVVISCQSTMSLGGYPSLICFTNMACSSFEKTSWIFVPNHLKLRYRTHAILSEFESTILELGLEASPTPILRSELSARIKTSKDRLDKAEVEFSPVEGSPLDAIYIQIARLQLEALQLHCNADSNNRTEIMQLFDTASGLIMSIKNLNDITNVASNSPSYLATSLSLAAFTLLRLMKSGFMQTLDSITIDEGKSSIFAAIHILKQISLINNDIHAKCAEYLSTMWTTQSLFKVSNASHWLSLRIRNRLSMSIVFDSLLIWVEEYGSCNYGTVALQRRQNEVETGKISIDCGEQTPYFSSDERWLYEVDWNASLDFLMADQVPVISYGS